MKRVIRLTAVAGGLLLALNLSGCTRTPKDGSLNGANGSNGNGDQSAQSYGVNGDGDMHGQNLAGNVAGRDYTVNYAFDSDVIDNQYMQGLNQEASYLLAHPNARVRLAGYTDNRGSREYNIALGWRRARAVAAYLGQQGVSARQLVLVSYGKERPVSNGDTEADYAKNRRTELTFENQG